MEKQSVKITIKTNGDYTFEAGEGINGESCREKTRNLELVLGGNLVSSDNKPEFYDGGDMNSNMNLNL